MNRKTVIQKIWDAHLVMDAGAGKSLLHIDRVVLHDRSGPRVLRRMAEIGRPLAHSALVLGTMDHIIDTHVGRTDSTLFAGGAEFIGEFRRLGGSAGIRIHDIGDPGQGIAHVMSPESGFALPGATLICCDSHTCTIGGIGALAWGIGVTEATHALATQTLVRPAPKQMRIVLQGRRQAGVSAKDIVLALIRRHGSTGGDNHIIEFAGPAAHALSVEERLTVCNMAVEFGAWTGLVAPDDAVFSYVHGRPMAPTGANWDLALAHWRSLVSDDDARWDRELALDVSDVPPMVTWGTNPEQGVAIDGYVPDPQSERDATKRKAMSSALEYMDLRPGQKMSELPIEAAFIGACTNSRLSDLRTAAQVLRGRTVKAGVLAIVVPGSSLVKAQAESEGLHRIFIDAGFQWRESGCSLCFYAGGDSFGAARRVVSSTNRNFEGRQGPGVRTHLASPATVAASAVTGCLTDPRTLAWDSR